MTEPPQQLLMSPPAQTVPSWHSALWACKSDSYWSAIHFCRGLFRLSTPRCWITFQTFETFARSLASLRDLYQQSPIPMHRKGILAWWWKQFKIYSLGWPNSTIDFLGTRNKTSTHLWWGTACEFAFLSSDGLKRFLNWSNSRRRLNQSVLTEALAKFKCRHDQFDEVKKWHPKNVYRKVQFML